MIIGMEFYKNIADMQSHLFLMLFIYIFIVHRYSPKKTAGICFLVFMLLCWAYGIELCDRGKPYRDHSVYLYGE